MERKSGILSEVVMSRNPILASMISILCLMGWLCMPASGDAPAAAGSGGISLYPLLQDDWTEEDLEEELEEDDIEEPPEDPADEPAIEEPPPPPPKEQARPQNQQPRRPGPRAGARGYRAGRGQARQMKNDQYNRYVSERFRGAPRRFTIKLAVDFGALSDNSAGGWSDYWTGERPVYGDLFDYSPSVALEGSLRILPFFEIAVGVSHVRLVGHMERVTAGSWVDIEEMTLTSLWAGPKITLPLALDARFWGSQDGLRDRRAVNLYLIPVTIGVTSLSECRAEYLGVEFDYYEKQVNFSFSTRMGFEMHFSGIGFFLEIGYAAYGKPKESGDGILDTDSKVLSAVFAEVGLFFCF